MHNNYYFLRQLSADIGRRITGFQLVACFSQNKDELILALEKGKEEFFIKAHLQPGFTCLSFPKTFDRARKNSADIFEPAIGKRVVTVKQYLNERSFAIELEGEKAIIFKMHGTNANVLWCGAGTVTTIFRSTLATDLELIPSHFDRTIDWTFENFERNQSSLEKIYFTFGNPVWHYLKRRGFTKASTTDRWKLLQDILAILERPAFYIESTEKGPSFTLLPTGSFSKVSDNPVDAINDFFYHYTSQTSFQRTKTSLLHEVETRLKRSAAYIEKTSNKLRELEQDQHYQEWADLIMANLHQLRIGLDHVVLESFYSPGVKVEVKLRKELNPQKNAEVFYRKAKNKSIEVNQLKESLQAKEIESRQLLEWQKIIQSAEELNDIKAVSSTLLKNISERESKITLPYHEFEFKGFVIRVGKNAAANDELTLKHSFKEDLWLHAKDVAGSHVLVKHQAGKPFPKDVIERAAEMAAYHSKRKNESLCPVAFTQKKFVRKRKGDPAGAVVVEREEVILVEPRK